ncbi:MAG: sulfite exporter TauE/SafE family protein [Microthrixaceae bacterium]|nr:sulfite exporter TauE/SafE family protein [Microthrixaceae bacterium]
MGSTVPAIIPGALSGAWRYSREGLVQWRIAITLGLSGSVMAVVGALASDAVNGRLLMVLTAFMMLWAGGSVVWRLRHPRMAAPADAARSERDEPRPSGLLVGALGVIAGFTAGLLGVGGGIIVVPVLSGPLRLPMRQAVASAW